MLRMLTSSRLPRSHPQVAGEAPQDPDVPQMGKLSLTTTKAFEGLPVILREKIYGFLVAFDSTDNTLHEDAEEDSCAPIYCYGKRVSYQSILAMFLVSKTIGAESRAYFHTQHPFVRIAAMDEATSNTVILASRKLRAVCYSVEKSTPPCMLRCTLSHVNRQYDGGESTTIISATYLPHFVQVLNLVLPTFIVEAHVALAFNPPASMSATDACKASFKVLAPFNALTHIYIVVMPTNINSMYAQALKTAMQSRPPLWPHLRHELDASRIRARTYIRANRPRAALLEYDENFRLCNVPRSTALLSADPAELLKQRVLALGGYISLAMPAGGPQAMRFMVDCVRRLLEPRGADVEPALRAKLCRGLGMLFLRRMEAWTAVEQSMGRPLEDLAEARGWFVKSLEDEPEGVSALWHLQQIAVSHAHWRAVVAAYRDLDA